MADHPLRPATDRCLGEPLPHQQANPTQAPPTARGPKIPRFPPWGVCGISPDFSGLSPSVGQIPTCYSPVRHSSAPRSSRRNPSGPLPFDLHVLGLPPAFNLSQDQTLQFKIFFRITRPGGLVIPECVAFTEMNTPHNYCCRSVVSISSASSVR